MSQPYSCEPNKSKATNDPQLQPQREWSLKAKVTAWALAISMLPVIVFGTIIYFGSQSINKHITQARLGGDTRLAEIEAAEIEAQQSQLLLVLIGTGATAGLAGAIAVILGLRAIRPILNAAVESATVVNRLHREEVSTRDRVAGKDEVVALETNISLIKELIPDLLRKQETEAERSQILMEITRRLRGALSEEDLFRTTVEEVRHAFRTERVVIFSFDTRWHGTFVAESVASGWPKTLWATIKDPCFEGEYVAQYRNGRVRAINNIYEAGLGDCHIGLLESFCVKANLIAPIIKDSKLFGLLIAHQCSSPRVWQQPEIDLFAELAAQVGFALDYARLVEQADTKADRAQVFIDITRRIRESLNEEDVIKTTVEEVRKAIGTDRVIVYSFDAKWYGSVVAESVVPGWPKTLLAQIKDPCFAEGYVEKYQAGRVTATNNIYEAGLTDCHMRQLEPFGVKANLVAPILKDDQLFGLLIAHECSKPREWQQSEINLFTQIAMQVGFALDHARMLARVDAEGVRTLLLTNVTSRIRESLNEEDVIKTTVEEVRKAIGTDRVIVYSFDAKWCGSVVAESVVPGWPKTLQVQIKDPCFAEGYVEKYQAGWVTAINNIYEAGLSDCYMRQLEPFGVKANLVAPILKDGQLFGLLIAHECSKPREWQQSEINLFAQIAMQVGFALDHARLLARVDAEGMRTQLFTNVTSRIRESLNEEDVIKTTVEEVRKAIGTDRVIVYSFDAKWYGSVVAESVVPGWPKTLQVQIKDPCFAEGYVEKYQAGRVTATNNIYEAGMSDCYMRQLEPFGVKANLVAPILKDGQLFGLLIAHECSKPREWQQSEINLFAQIAMQVGFALDHARLLNQIEQAHQGAEVVSHQLRQQKSALQNQVLEMLRDSETAVENLSTAALSQMEFITAAYNQIQTVVNSAREMNACAQQVKLHKQQVRQTLQAEQQAMNRIVDDISAFQNKFVEANVKVKRIDELSQKLCAVMDLISDVASQLKLQAMNATFEAARTDEAGRVSAFIAEKVLGSARLLDVDTEFKPLVQEIQAENFEVAAAMKAWTEQAIAGTQLVEERAQKLNSIADVIVQMSSLVEDISQSAANQAQTWAFASQSVLEVSSIASHTSEQSVALAKSFNNLAAQLST